MKKLLLVLALICAITVCFAACARDDEKSAQDETYEQYVERVGEPYIISYLPNDDGTCSVEEISINSNFKRNFKLEIPEKSPDGDTVVAMDTVGFLEHDNVPRMMAKEDADKLFARLEEAMEASKEDNWWEWYYQRFCGYYVPVSLYEISLETGEFILDMNGNKIIKSEQDREKLLSDFPVLEQMDVVYILNLGLELGGAYRAYAMKNLSETLTTYLNYTEKERFAIDILMTSEYEKNQPNCCDCPIYMGSSHIEEIDFPDSIVKYNSGLQGLSDNAYTKFGNAYYVGTKNNKYKILVQAMGADIIACEVNPSAEIIAPYAFYKCENLQSVKISNSVTSIGFGAFNGCISLASVVIGDSVTSIGDDAFNNCESLTSVVIPDSVTSIGEYAFFYCESLTSVVIPDSVVSIGESAFEGCESLTIYCEAVECPSDWYGSWNYMNRGQYCPVVWGYKVD